MNTWQHQQQMDEQERLEEIKRLLDEGEVAVSAQWASQGCHSPEYQASEWRAELETALGLPKPSTPVPDTKEPF